MRFKKDDETTIKCAKKGRAVLLGLHPNLQSEVGKKSRLYENETAKTIQANKIYLPCEVCDRIVVRNGKIFFVEIKHKGENLRPKQSEFQQIAKDQYEIMYGE
jgi:glutamine amidotransferase-like uncharacterized protein